MTKIHGLLEEIWNTNQIPEDWKTVIIYPRFKKGDPMDTKVYSKDIIGDCQSGFLRKKSISDHFFMIRLTMEKCYEFGKDAHMCFRNLEFLKKRIRLIKECNTHTLSKVKFGNGILESFEVKTGLKQGDALSPVLLNLVLEKVVGSVPIRQGMEILFNNMLLAYADDIVCINYTIK
ncbi:hypothetical protein AGLY_011962 [Aphis glycines]|uniref:Reverse transcriptase domain-containing protein n=1 Tax=Aphis glycines TaxID=307491 RepID=A0A6G0TAE6_APHGL|nr:hypothetical protein AGLY_011962 [Aphis glycines]